MCVCIHASTHVHVNNHSHYAHLVFTNFVDCWTLSSAFSGAKTESRDSPKP